MDDYYPQQPAARPGRSPSGSGFDEPPVRRRQAAGYEDEAGEHRQQYPPQSGHGRSPSGAPYRDETTYDGRSPYERSSYESSPYESGPYERSTGGRQSYEPTPEWQDSGWHTSPQSGWPQQPAAQQGWPQGQQQQGWPREYGEPDRGWDAPEQGDALEALPPLGEVHHDWPARDERPRRGWLAPEDDTNGDEW
jgi:hypothetical protein